MRPVLKVIAVAGLTGLVAHFGVMLATPYKLMDVAMSRIRGPANRSNVWVHLPRTTEAARMVVRPSPDLAYSSCAYDLSNGPVLVQAAAWKDYMSVSVYQANSDNIYVANDRLHPDGVAFVLVRRGRPHPPTPLPVVESPSRRGIVLERRLAPTAEAFNRAAAARRNDLCTPFQG